MSMMPSAVWASSNSADFLAVRPVAPSSSLRNVCALAALTARVVAPPVTN